MNGADTLDVEYISYHSPVIIGGCGRSGTTLLRVMLDTHPDLVIGPESWLFHPAPIDVTRLAWLYQVDEWKVRQIYLSVGSRAEFIDRFSWMVLRTVGKERWGDKTPVNVRHLGYIFSAFPGARFLHVVRDGRDVVCSLRTHPRYRWNGEGWVATSDREPNSWVHCFGRWVSDIEASRPWWGTSRHEWVRYEDLALAPHRTLARVLDWLGMDARSEVVERCVSYHEVPRDPARFPQNPEVLQPLYTRAIGRWYADMPPDVYREFMETGGYLLRELGYSRGRGCGASEEG